MPSIETADIHNAVTAGVIDAASADRLLEYVANKHVVGNQHADEEQFRLVNSFNDVFVTIGIVLFLSAIRWLVPSSLLGDAGSGGLLVPRGFEPSLVAAAASWGLAEVFTRRRRMAFPSLVLLAAFVIFVAVSAVEFFSAVFPDPDPANNSLHQSLFVVAPSALCAALAAAAHWFRFKVPVTVAAGVAALAAFALALLTYADQNVIRDYPYFTVLPVGLIILALALRFDASDRLRLTRRTDIAFWLHMLAAPMIVHPIIAPMLDSGNVSTSSAFIIIAVFLVMSALALVIDRRALLVSSLIYLGYATYQVVKLAGVETQGAATATLIVGATVLLLSIGWTTLRKFVVSLLSESVQKKIPPIKP